MQEFQFPHKNQLPSKLPDLIQFLTDNEPSVPDELTRYLLRTVGVDMQDESALRLVSLVTQHFMATVLHDVYLLRAQRVKHMPAKALKQMGLDANAAPVLTTEDLAHVLDDAGVHLKRELYYIDAKQDAL